MLSETLTNPGVWYGLVRMIGIGLGSLTIGLYFGYGLTLIRRGK